MKLHRTKKLPGKPANYVVNVVASEPFYRRNLTERFTFATVAEVEAFTESLTTKEGWTEFLKYNFERGSELTGFEIFEHAADGVYELSNSKHDPDLGPPLT